MFSWQRQEPALCKETKSWHVGCDMDERASTWSYGAMKVVDGNSSLLPAKFVCAVLFCGISWALNISLFMSF